MIKAAYNFVPIEESKKYYSPKWKDTVSHDIPFSDSASGEISLKLEANTPIFVKGNDGNFVNIEEMEFIPGTSIKGCIRSVLEILSYGHLNNERVHNESIPYRLIDDRSGYMQKMQDVHGGWLIEKDGKHIVIDCGIPAKIRYGEIAKSFHIDYKNLKNAEDIPAKYALTGKHYLKGNFVEDKFAIPDKKPFDNRRFYKKDVSGKSGTIIFTGYMTNKKSDFIFFENTGGKRLNVSKLVYGSFQKLNPDYKKIPQYSDGIENGIPVFFTFNGNEVKTMGLSYLHRYYAENKIYDAIPQEAKGTDPDLADIMFGSTAHNLKGRIQIGHARKTEGKLLLNKGESIETVLGSPKASYFPTYLKNWNTWDTKGATILGRKRYPIKPHYDAAKLKSLIPTNTDEERNEDTISHLKPLGIGAKFECKIRFHNLNKIELGALLSAVTFHGKQNDCKHSLGQAKAYGYGSVSFQISKITINGSGFDNLETTISEYLKHFQDEMNTHIANWIDSSPVKELFAMAKGFSEEHLVDIFTPMILKNRSDRNEFADARLSYIKKQETFKSYTETVGNDSAKKTDEIPVKPSIFEKEKAVVTVVDGGIIQAKLLTGKDTQSKKLVIGSNKIKLKMGDQIIVSIVRKGGNIDHLVLKSIIK